MRPIGQPKRVEIWALGILGKSTSNWDVLERQNGALYPNIWFFHVFLEVATPNHYGKHWSSERTDRLTTRVFFWWCYAALFEPAAGNFWLFFAVCGVGGLEGWGEANNVLLPSFLQRAFPATCFWDVTLLAWSWNFVHALDATLLSSSCDFVHALDAMFWTWSCHVVHALEPILTWKDWQVWEETMRSLQSRANTIERQHDVTSNSIKSCSKLVFWKNRQMQTSKKQRGHYTAGYYLDWERRNWTMVWGN